jgi:hypothetical protein
MLREKPKSNMVGMFKFAARLRREMSIAILFGYTSKVRCGLLSEEPDSHDHIAGPEVQMESVDETTSSCYSSLCGSVR